MMERTALPTMCLACRNGACMKKLPVFQELSDQMQSLLLTKALPVKRDKNNLLFEEGDSIDSIYIIQRGEIKLCRFDEDGREYILDILRDGDSIWESLFLEDSMYPYSAVCLTEAEFCQVRKKDFTEVLTHEPEAAIHLIGILSQRLQDAKEHARLLTIPEADIRLAGFLLDRERRWPGNEIHMRLEDIASSINLRSETVSRILRRFEKDGIIERHGHGKFVIRDFEKLRDVYA